MYNFIKVNGTRLSRLQEIDSKINIVEPNDLEHFKHLVDVGYKVLIDALINESIEDNPYIKYVEEKKIPVLIDALYEANVMKFHNVNIDTPKTLLVSNLELTNHEGFENAILLPYFFIQSYVLWTKEFPKRFVTTALDVNDHLDTEKLSCLCLNGINRLGRRFVYDYFKDNNLINDATFSFHNRGSEEQWKNEYPIIKLSNDIKVKDDGVQWDNLFDHSWFKKTWFNLVTESASHNEANRTSKALIKNQNCFFPTEKVFKPIYHCQPFICIAHTNFHNNLKKYLDIELYDEIWDYSFDEEEDYLKRWLMVCDQAKEKIENGIDYNLIKEKLKHNQSILLDENRHKKFVSEFLLEIDKTHI